MTLEQEAEQYIDKSWGSYKNDVFQHNDIITDKTLADITKQDYIEGATSKYVEIEKIKFAIEQIKKIDENKCSDNEHNSFYDLLEMQSNVIKELEQKLKQLEDE
jgi:hypothetical protein